MDYITVIVSDTRHREVIRTALREYEAVTGAKVSEAAYPCHSIASYGVAWMDHLN